MRLLLLELPLHGEPPQGALFDERCVAAVVRGRAVGLEVQHVIRHRREKRSVVADQQDRHWRRGKVRLEPGGRLQVEMVRRLVEQEHVGGSDELAHEPEPTAFAAAQLRDGRRASRRWVEAQTVQHRVDARRDRVAAFSFEPLEIRAISRKAGFVLAEPFCLRDQIALQRQKFGERTGRCFPNGRRSAELPMLFEERNAQARPLRDLAARRLDLAGQQAKKRRLARAVSPDDSPALPGCDREGHVVEDLARAKIDAGA